jgi:hypothetical protein
VEANEPEANEPEANEPEAGANEAEANEPEVWGPGSRESVLGGADLGVCVWDSFGRENSCICEPRGVVGNGVLGKGIVRKGVDGNSWHSGRLWFIGLEFSTDIALRFVGLTVGDGLGQVTTLEWNDASGDCE